MKDSFFVSLPNRGLITVSGADRFAFLQGLITNDIDLLRTQACVYACLLSPQGKFLHDFFITQRGDAVLIECEGGERAQDLFKKLTMYKLRAQVELTVQTDIPVFVVFGDQALPPDPRHADLGARTYTKPDLPEKSFEEWDTRRIRLCVPDGSRDLIIGQSTMDEARMDTHNAISYSKGCYVGQELTARMHYRGLGKKHLQMVDISTMPAGAELRSRCGPIGLALVRY